MPAHKRARAAADEEHESKPVYLVVEHNVNEPSHSIVVAGTTMPTMMVPLRYANHGMSFAVVDSRWIVGVGGDHRCHFTIYDLTTSTESGGPWLYSNKVSPVLIPHHDMLYVLSSRPRIDVGADFLPWFEVIIFRDGCVPLMGGCASHKLPLPPIFPACINPIEYLDPPDVRVAAHALVGSRILLSVSYTASDSVRQQMLMQIPPEDPDEEKGTCAFDVDMRKWEMVHHRNLPFLGEALPLGGHLFATTCPKNDAVSVYHIEILSVGKEGAKKTELRVMELQMVGRRIVPSQLLCSSGKGRLCTFDVRFKDLVDGHVLAKARVMHHTYNVTLVNIETTNAPVNVVVKRRRRRIHKLIDRSRGLAYPTPVVAVLT